MGFSHTRRADDDQIVRILQSGRDGESLFYLQLGQGKAEELIIAGKFSDPVIALVFFNAFVKLITWQMLQYLCKNGY